MAINKNHEFEELDGVKCGIVEKNVSPIRVEFLKEILSVNGYTVMVVPSPAPKVVETVDPAPVVAETFTVGVTDYTFNSINAIFGRALKTKNGHIVTNAYWHQLEKECQEEIPYYNYTRTK